MKKELLNCLLAKSQRKRNWFVMPGHKGRDFGYLKGLNLSADTTETYDTDNLNNPVDIIMRSQERAAEIFGAKKTYYTINGTSGAMIAAVTALTLPGDKILVSRNCHVCVYRAAAIRRLELDYILPEVKDTVDRNVTPEEVEKRIIETDPKLVIVTNPTFFGYTTDIQKIVDICNKHGVLLIVDEAHGAHFPFSDNLPLSAVHAGADIVVHSTHKTLLGLTSANMIHVCSNRVDTEELMRCITTYQTTSPNYLITLSNELSAAFMTEGGKEVLEDNIKWANEAADEINKIPGLSCLKDPCKDPLKIIVDTSKLINGREFAKYLFDKKDMDSEMCDEMHIDFYAGIGNIESDYKELVQALKEAAAEVEPHPVVQNPPKIQIPEVQLDICDALDADFYLEDVSEAVGKVSVDYIMPYPPGIPLILPGEVITEDAIQFFDKPKIKIFKKSPFF